MLRSLNDATHYLRTAPAGSQACYFSGHLAKRRFTARWFPDAGAAEGLEVADLVWAAAHAGYVHLFQTRRSDDGGYFYWLRVVRPLPQTVKIKELLNDAKEKDEGDLRAARRRRDARRHDGRAHARHAVRA